MRRYLIPHSPPHHVPTATLRVIPDFAAVRENAGVYALHEADGDIVWTAGSAWSVCLARFIQGNCSIYQITKCSILINWFGVVLDSGGAAADQTDVLPPFHHVAHGIPFGCGQRRQ